MRIQHNILAMNAYRNYNNNTSALSKNLEKLSSGYKINRAGDDAAGLAISEKMRAQITGLNAAQKNVKDGISLVKTAEGAMQEIHDMLNRMDYLATQSANGTYDDPVDRLNLQKEISSLKSEINRIADSANFNGIKLLDGSLDVNGEISITTEAPKIEDHAGVDGITVGDAEQGGGSNGTFTINIDQLLGDADALTISWGKGSGFIDATTAAADATGNTVASAGNANTTALQGNTTTLTFDTENEGLTALATGTFTGKTTAEQAESIANVLKQNSDISAQFDIEAKGSKVILTNKNEGNDQTTVDKVEAKTAGGDDNVKSEYAAKVEANGPTAVAGGTATAFTFTDLFKNNGGWEFEKGDVLTFEAKDANGNTWTAKLELTEDLIGVDDHTTQANIIAKLNQPDDKKAVYFEPNDKTVTAEETLKFSDVFTAAVDGTDDVNLKVSAKDAGVFGSTGSLKLSTTNSNVSAPKTGTLSGGTGGVAHKISYKLNGAGAATDKDTNYSVGDKLTIKGKLSDGREFEVEMEAGKDFDVGADEQKTVENIAKALSDSKSDKTATITKTITNADGTTSKETSEALVSDIFSTEANKKEIMVSYDATNKLTFTSQVEGPTLNGHVSEVKLDAAKPGAISSDLRNGVQKTSASSSVSFDTLEEGTTLKVGDTTYQFVTAADKAEAGNTAVVVDNLSNGESIAKALSEQLTKDAGATNPAYTVSQEGNQVTVTTTDKGKDVSAIEIKSGAPSHEDVVFELQPNKLKAGSTITVDGKTFEFIDTNKDKNAKAADGNIAIDVDMVKGDKTEINQAMVDALAKEGFEARLEDNKVKICNDGEENVKIEFNNGKALTLQIGDTSDSFNQLSVNVGDMHTWAMNIDNIDISTQEGAQAAIDVIKNAINYVSGVRGDLGAVQNRLDHTANNLSVMAENIQDAESAIRDTDVAEEMMAYTKNNILIQSAQAMLAQANQVPQGVLQLLG